MNSTITPPGGRDPVLWRRLIFCTLVVLTILAISWQALQVYLINGFQPLEWPMLPLFVVLVLPLAMSFWTAVAGFFVQLMGRDSLALTHSEAERTPVDFDSFRTAIVIPAYNEDTVRLFAGLRATYESVARSGCLKHFEFFVLSDSTDPDSWVREELAFEDLRGELSDPSRVFYRNRRDNVERKPGNIADFCAQWGGRYRYMIVFDTDSLMTGKSLINMVRLMERHPNAGIIQTPPMPVNRQSLLGRLLQFTMRAYGPLLIRGLNFLQAGEGCYWGHNAIIRVVPFVEHCRLPKLPGKGPLAGSILSHDFIEAAYMRRAGWKVYLASDLRGSYEETPANLIGVAARDRRWCQGNLQHARLMRTPGLHWVSRLQLALGMMAYLSSPLWLLMLALGTAEGLREALTPHAYFASGSPFPVWQVSMVGRGAALFASVMSLMIVPKLLSLLSMILQNHRTTASMGGLRRLSTSVLVEILFSTMLSPVLAVLHSRFVIGTLMGRSVSWDAPDRGDAPTTFREAAKRHAGITVLGVLWSALLLWNSPALFGWLSPVLLGLVLAIPLSVWTSRVRAGQWARRRGLFLIPEEIRAPFLLRCFRAETERLAARPWVACHDGLTFVLRDAQARSVHLALLPPPAANDPLTENRLEGLRLKLNLNGAAALQPKEKRELLFDARSICLLASETDAAEPPKDSLETGGASQALAA